MRFGSRSERVFFSQIRHRNALTEMGRRRTGNRHGNVYREKQGNVGYRQRVLQTVTSLHVVSLVFRGHDLLKITNINPQQEARFLLWKKLDYSPGGGDSLMKKTGMLVVSIRGVNFGFWSRLGCSGQSANILSRQGLV